MFPLVKSRGLTRARLTLSGIKEHSHALRNIQNNEKKKKMAGSDPTSVKPNQFVELHGHAREVVEKTFKFSPRTLGVIGIFGIAVPYLLYQGCVNEFHAADDKYNRERKKFM